MSQPAALEHPLVIPPRLTRGRRSRWRLLWLPFLACILFAALFLVDSSRPEKPPRFRTALADRRTITKTVEANGELDVPSRYDVGSPIAGRIVELRVESGMRVRKGDVLARLDPRAASVDVRTARAEERAAKGRLADAEARYGASVDARKRAERMLELNLAKPRDLLQAKANEQSALGVRDALRAELDAVGGKRAGAELVRSELTLRAPIDGFVLSLPTATGGLVGPERGTLFTIGDTLDTLRLEASVSEADIGDVRSGQNASFKVPAFGDRGFSARVARVLIEPVRKAGAVSYRVLLVADNPDHVLLPGMTAAVSIEVLKAENVLAVREAALRFNPDEVVPGTPRRRIWTSADGITVAAVDVVPGISDGAYTQIEPVSGATLSAGDRVVVGVISFEKSGTNGPGIRLGAKP